MYLSLYGGFNGLISLNSSLDTGWTWANNSTDALEKLCVNNEKNIVAITGSGFLKGIYANTGKTAFSKKTFNKLFLNYYQTNTSTSLYQFKDYYYFFHGTLLHTKISLTGDSITTKKLFDAGEYDRGNSIADESGFTFLYLSRKNLPWTFVKTDENYQIMDSTSFDVKGGAKTTCIILKDTFGNYLLGGNTEWGRNMRILKYKLTELTNTVSALESNISCYYSQEFEKILIKSKKNYENMKVEIFNPSGSLMSFNNFNNEEEFFISTSGYHSGIYLLRISNNGNVLTSNKIAVK